MNHLRPKPLSLLTSLLIVTLATTAFAQPREEEDYLFLAEKSVHVASGATINGNVGVQLAKSKAKVGQESVMANDTVVIANKVNLSGLSTVFDVWANKLNFKPADTTINGSIVGPIPPPVYVTEPLVLPDPFDSTNYPAAWPVQCGVISHEILSGQTLPLTPGAFNKITVRPGGSLILAPGTYQFCDLRIYGDVTATGPIEVNIKNSFTMLQNSTFQPSGGATASDIQINLEGKKTVRFGDDTIVSLRLYAPKATLKIRAGAVLTGHFVSRKMGCSSRFTANPGPPPVVPPVCGDDLVNAPDETCDPPGSTLSNGNTCRGDCTYCGDGIVDSGEACDDGNTNNNDTCSNSCTINPLCGDGTINASGETCDPPGSTQSNGNVCRGDCTYCGDGLIDAGEQCDDGNTNNNDTCANNCTLNPLCGDGSINAPGETCEPPGSTQSNGNVCRGDCTYCGDGSVDAGEQCDDGNTNNGDACANDCTLNVFCGDGSVNAAGETCDPPGSTQSNGNVCRGDCTYCGDGHQDSGEQCDDGNTNNHDACANDCTANNPSIDICKDDEGPNVRNITAGQQTIYIPVMNGDFEEPNLSNCQISSIDPIPGWTTSNTNQYTFLGIRNGANGCSLEAPEGDQYLKLTEVTIDQVIGVVTEATVCDLNFWVRRGASNTTEHVKVFAGATELISVGPGSGSGSWVERSGTFSIPASLIGQPIRVEIDQWASSANDYSYYDDIRVSCDTSTTANIEFEIKVENDGNVPLTGVVVDDPLVSNCDRNIGNLAVGATETYTCSTTVPVNAMTWLDEFGSTSYSNNDGDTNFSGPWVEVDGQGGGASSGNVWVAGGRLKLNDSPDTGGHPSATRSADLSGKDVALLSFDFLLTDGVDSSDSAAVQISSDGTNFTTLEEFTGYTGSATGSRSYDISAYISSQTSVRFIILNTYGVDDEIFKVDNVSIVATSFGQLVNEACASGNGGGTTVDDCDTSTVNVNSPTPSCGDGLINQLTETCDPQGSTPTCGWCGSRSCRSDCTFCGDGNVDPGEDCDDANSNNSDGCPNDCTH